MLSFLSSIKIDILLHLKNIDLIYIYRRELYEKNGEKSLILTVVAVLSSTVVSSVEAISSDEAVQSALARVLVQRLQM